MRHHYVGIASYLSAFVILSDQFTKWWVMANVKPYPSFYPVASFVDFTLVWNKGVTFGLMNRVDHRLMPWLLVVMALGGLVMLGRWLWRTRSLIVTLALGAIIGVIRASLNSVRMRRSNPPICCCRLPDWRDARKLIVSGNR